MSALVDARVLRASGLGRYLREVLSHLLRDPRFREITLLGDVPAVERFVAEHAPEPGRIRVHPFPTRLYSPRAQLEWLLPRRVQGADVCFFPHYDAPLRMPPRSVLTVHDLIHFQVPDAFAVWRRAAGAWMLRHVTRRAARVITVSDATRRDLLRRVPGIEDRVEVVHNGVSDFFRERGDPDDPWRAEGESLRPFVLCVGNRKPHKNLVAAVEALALLREQHRDLRLVVAGRSYPGWDVVRARAEALGVRAAVVELDGVDDARLRSLYRSCEALLFPSLYEGFGLPVLEAMACGAPVVASNRSSIPEVAGEAGVLVDPHDHQGMARAVAEILSNPRWRAELSRRGRERADRFSWQRSAQATLDVLYEVARTGEPRRNS